jgi:hypothetical protein
MRLPIFILLFGAALLATGIALRVATQSRNQPAVQFATALSGGGVGLWLIVLISAFNVVTVSNGSELQHSYPSLAALGVAGVGVSTLILVKGSIEMLDS